MRMRRVALSYVVCLAQPYFSKLSHKGTIFFKFFYFLRNSVWKISNSKKKSVGYYRKYWSWYIIYLLTAIGLSPGGSSTVHIYTQTIHREIQNKKYMEQHNNFGRVRAVPRLG